MTALHTLFSPELRQKVIQYMLGKYQGDTEWFQREVGKPMSLRELLALVSERYPQEVQRVNQIVLEGLRGADPNEWERREIKRRAFRDFDIGYGWDLPSGVPGLWRAKDPRGYEAFDAYIPDPKHPTTGAAKEAVMAWVARRGPPILTLAGSPGVGKSHLTDAAGSVLLAQGDDVVFREASKLFEEFHKAVGSNTLEDLLRAYGSVPWLIVDDFGQGAATDWGRYIQDRLVNDRWTGARGGLRTLATMNLKAPDLPPRVASRLGDRSLGLVVMISAPDYRKRGGK
ncbi:MAG: ATP-binding protein [Chloroflexota bacterium]|nr:ATP-binding protein [Chloroflexota bacterium]